MIKRLATVKEVCELLQIKPPRAYELARLWEMTNGKEGLPCVRLGVRQLRFYMAGIEAALKRHEPENEGEK